MERRRTALHSSAIRTFAHDGSEPIVFGALVAKNQVQWLDPQPFESLRRRRGGFRHGLRVSTTLAVGAVLTILSANSAVAPAVAYSSPDLAMPETTGTVQMSPSLPAEAHAPLIIEANSEPAKEAVASLPGAPDLQNADPAENVPAAEVKAPAAAPSAPAAAVMPLTGPDFDDEEAETVERDPNEILEFGEMKVRRHVAEKIVRAAEVTGVDPVYLMALADKESSFSTDVKAKTSSAEGLFQFIASTWLDTVRRYGAQYGLAAEAAAIEIVDGQPTITDEATRERVLGLRRDPYLAAVMAAEMKKRDRARIEQRLGRNMSPSEYYLAHFLGPDSAGKLMEMIGDKPKASATKAFPRAAKANRSLFYEKVGRKTRQVTVSELYDRIDRLMDKRLDRYTGVTERIDVKVQAE